MKKDKKQNLDNQQNNNFINKEPKKNTIWFGIFITILSMLIIFFIYKVFKTTDSVIISLLFFGSIISYNQELKELWKN